MVQVLRHIYRTLQQQSNIMAYVDAFTMMGLLVLGALAISIFVLPKNTLGAGAAPSGH